MKPKSFYIFFYCFTLLTLLKVEDAYAYLDPGTGSMLFQSLIAAIAGGLFLIKTYWTKLKNFFVKNETQPQQSGEQEKK